MINIDIDNGIKINIYRYLKMKIVFMQQSRSNVRLSQQKVAQCNTAALQHCNTVAICMYSLAPLDKKPSSDIESFFARFHALHFFR